MDLEIIKVWIANALAFVLILMETSKPYIEYLGVLAATIYTFYKLYDHIKTRNKDETDD